ncbi:MAG: ATP-binding protein, partial [Candidatus Saccharimonadales bacterium]|nr:ATP-binding protein [Candidatus Saccharimonadales bacterium]
YAMVSQKLFDIRLLIARTIAYIVLIGFVGLLSAIALFAGSQLLLDDDAFSAPQQLVAILIALVLSLLFQPIRRGIDRFTKRFFYRDAYDSAEVLNNLSSTLATEIELFTIVKDSSNLLSESLKPTHLRFVVFNEEVVFYDYGTSKAPNKKVNKSNFSEIDEQLLIKEQQDTKVSELFDKYDADAVLKLETNESFVGVILIGPKLSGDAYTQQDIELMKIVDKELSIAIQNSLFFEQIQKFNITLQRKIKQATTRLEHSNQKLKDLDEAKDEFISMASHQLRTPLTSIKGYVSMVMDGDAGKVNKQQKKLLAEAFASSQRMVYLIADLLNVSRLKTGKFIIEPTEVDLSQIVQDEVGQLEPTAQQRNLKLSYTKPRRFPKTMLDETKIRQVVMNFVDNAIYYTPAGGKIDVSVKATKKYIEFVVKDNGIGIPKDIQAKLFTKFYRAPNAMKARPDGTGLGLFMAKKVVIAQGGSIIFSSEEGKGSIFGFRFQR